MKLHARNSNGNKNGSLQRKNYLDDCLDKFDVLLLVKDGEVCLSHVSQSEICSYPPSLVRLFWLRVVRSLRQGRAGK